MQFTRTIAQIVASETTPAMKGIVRHLWWQLRRAVWCFPVELPISESILVADRPSGVAALVNCMGMYDFNNMTLIRYLLRATHGVFFDVGANIGAYSLIASEVRDAIVVSIEPHPESYRLLSGNVFRNQRNNITCVNAAASDHIGSLQISDGGELSTNRVLGHSCRVKSVTVRCTTLDQLCNDLRLCPAVIKIDVEGYEDHVLAGHSGHENTLAIVIENGEKPSIQMKLHAAGYRGPLYFHATNCTFSEQKQRRPEDPVYCRPSVLEHQWSS